MLRWPMRSNQPAAAAAARAGVRMHTRTCAFVLPTITMMTMLSSCQTIHTKRTAAESIMPVPVASLPLPVVRTYVPEQSHALQSHDNRSVQSISTRFSDVYNVRVSRIPRIPITRFAPLTRLALALVPSPRFQAMHGVRSREHDTTGQHTHTDVTGYLGIRYAAPPLHERRFRESELLPGILSAHSPRADKCGAGSALLAV